MSAALIAPRKVLATLEAAPRRLSLFRTHTGDGLSVVYYAEGSYLEDALGRLDKFLADFRTGEVRALDPGLYDILHGIQQLTGRNEVFEVIAAYRSPKTNEMLRQRSTGVAKNSLHMQGKAMDVRLRRFNTAKLRDAALSLRLGSVGYYAKSDFVHLDTGRVRHW